MSGSEDAALTGLLREWSDGDREALDQLIPEGNIGSMEFEHKEIRNRRAKMGREQRTNRTYGYLSVKKPPIPGLIHAVWPFVVWFTNNIFREDQEIVEFEQRAYDAQGADWNNEVFPALRDLREVLGRCGKPMKA